MPAINYYLLQEDGSYVLQEDGSGIIIYSENIPLPTTASVPYNLGLTAETTIYVNEVKCRVLENDFNYSQNPTVFKNKTFVTGALAKPFYGPEGGRAQVGIITDGTIADNLTGSAFNPYATTIGLFSPANELLVVGKFATPYPIPENTDITFIVRWDS
jgi:hypothetical protein